MSQPKTLDEAGKVNLASETYIIHDGKILLFRRSEDSNRFPGYWIGPGGHIDENEDALTAAIREVAEETGITVLEKDIKLKAIAFHTHRDLGEVWVSNIYLATISESFETHNGIAGEGKGEWIDIEEAMKMEKVFPPAKYYFEHVLGDRPGIMYTNIVWEKSQLVQVNSQRVDTNF